jgi:hypothetical protein
MSINNYSISVLDVGNFNTSTSAYELNNRNPTENDSSPIIQAHPLDKEYPPTIQEKIKGYARKGIRWVKNNKKKSALICGSIILGVLVIVLTLVLLLLQLLNIAVRLQT